MQCMACQTWLRELHNHVHQHMRPYDVCCSSCLWLTPCRQEFRATRNTIRQVKANDKKIYRVLGPSDNGNSGDAHQLSISAAVRMPAGNAMAFSPDYTTLYFCDATNKRVRAMSCSALV